MVLPPLSDTPSDNEVEQLLQQAIALYQNKNFLEAESNFLLIRNYQHNNSEAHYFLGLLSLEKNDPAESLSFFETALNIQPDNGAYWLAYIDALQQTGDTETALEVLKLAVQSGLQGPEVDTLFKLLQSEKQQSSNTSQADSRKMDSLIALYQKQAYVECESLAHKILESQPDNGLTWKILGASLKQQDRLEEAILAMTQAKQLLPGDPQVLNNLGIALENSGNYRESETALRQAVSIDHTFTEAYNSLGVTLMAQGKYKESENCFRKAIDLDFDYVQAYCNLGKNLLEQQRLTDAEEVLTEGINRNSEFSLSYHYLGYVQLRLHKLSEAEKTIRKALELQPDSATEYRNLGSCLREQGRLDLSLHAYQKSLELKPDFCEAYDSLLFTVNYHPDKSREEIFKLYQEYDSRFSYPIEERYKAYSNSKEDNRPLKIGYVSPSFYNHSTSNFLLPLLENHDTTKFELFAYSESTIADKTTSHYKKLLKNWVSTTGLSTIDLAERIRADKIDILVDLAGHTAGNRLKLFSLKPAPISLHWLDFGYTTGISSIDYYLTDSDTVPPGTEMFFSEKIWRLPQAALVYRPTKNMGMPGPLPADKNGYITFSTLTRAIRLTDKTIDVWCEILRKVEKSILIIDSSNFKSKETKQYFIEKFTSRGIEEHRLGIGYHSPPWDLLRTSDITLDCFPHNSGTTLFESLYMGVPFVTLAGAPAIGRIGCSLLQAANHPEWIAHNEEEYITKVVTLASDLPKLACIRENLRQEMQQSTLMDEEGFTRQVETAFRSMFRNWAEIPSPEVAREVTEDTGHQNSMALDQYNRAIAFHQGGDIVQAKQCYLQALNLQNHFIEAYNNLGVCFQQEKNHNDAIPCFTKALALKEDYADACFNRANSYKIQNDLIEAEKNYRKTIELQKDYKGAHYNLGNILQEQGRVNEAESALRRALQLNPGDIKAFSTLLYCLNYHHEKDPADIFKEYVTFDKTYYKKYRKYWPKHLNSTRKNRKIRIGYVAADYQKHPARYFLAPLLTHHNHEHFEFFAYVETRKEDKEKDLFYPHVEHWASTMYQSDEQLYTSIIEDHIDILVDLAGHTAHNKLAVFARKPAPISLHYLDFGYTTGLTAIDYYLSDEITAPPGSEHLFSEKPWHITTPALAYRPPESTGEVSNLPANRNHYVTFGSLTRAVRINPMTIRVWAKILQQVTHSRLVINSGSFRDPILQKRLKDSFQQLGIDSERLEIGCTSPPWDILRSIDICLDCFPHNSGTTLVESLYMGVPYITLASRPSVGTLGSSILIGVGHPEWISSTEEQYIQLAVDLANDLPALAEIRKSLRPKMERSPLMDEAGFAKKVENAYREMFGLWINNRIKSNKQKSKNRTESPTPEKLQQLVHLFQHNKLDEGVTLSRSLIETFPQNGFSWKALGTFLHHKNKLSEAQWALEEASFLLPEDAELHNNIGNIHQELDNYQKAEKCFKKALSLNSQYGEAAFNLANCYEKTGSYFQAVHYFRLAIKLGCASEDVYNNLGNTLRSFGELDEAEIALKKAIEINPNYLQAYSNLFFLENNIPDKSLDEIYSDYQLFDQLFLKVPQTKNWPGPADKSDQAPLNIGYISPRFCKHSSRHFLEPLLAHHHKDRVKIYAYSDNESEDQITERYKSYVDHWRTTAHLDDDHLYQQIQKDKIDILVDIAGHTVGNRLPLFARKPAPVSLHWLDFGYTTGLRAIDYYLTDEITVPKGSEKYFSEKPWRLTTPALVYRPANGMGLVGPLPMQRNGYVTFGSLTRAVRLNHRTIQAWCQILKMVPNSHLVINSVNFQNEEIQNHFADKFMQCGIKRDRLDIGFSSPPWDVYRNIDISLDCFPHNSGTTLLESLYMGIPFITLQDRPSVGTLGSSILMGVNHPEWIAATEEKYIEQAVKLASNHSLLADTRKSLRHEMEQSPLMDERGFAEKVEEAYRSMFQIFKEQTKPETKEATNIVIQALQQAQICREAGRLTEARDLYQTILSLEPEQPEAYFQLGLLTAIDFQQIDEGLTYLQKAAEIAPDNYQYMVCYIEILLQTGQLKLATDVLQRALQNGLKGDELSILQQRIHAGLSSQSIEEKPSNDRVKNIIHLFNTKQYNQCEEVAKATITEFPEHAFARKALGSTLHLQGRLEEALLEFKQAINCGDKDPELHNNLANIYDELANYPEAIKEYQLAIELDSKYFEAHINLAKTLQRQSNYQDSITYLKKALKLKGDKSQLYYFLGVALTKLGNIQEAKNNFTKAIKVSPSNPDPYNELAIIHKEQGNFQQAEKAFLKLLKLTPDSAQGYSNLAHLYWNSGKLDKSEAALKKAMKIEPHCPAIFSNYLFLINNKPQVSAEDLYKNYQDFNELFGKPLQKEWKTFKNKQFDNRKLRVGYVSPSLFSHSTHHFLEPLLSNHDKGVVEVFCYSDCLESDLVTKRYRTYSDHWLDSNSMSDAELTERIRLDQIDVLVDLAGHTGGNRLMVFARKPAPVSLHWLDFGYTTGLPAIDYYLTDPVTCPVDSDHLFAETPWRIDPPAFVYRPGKGMGEVNPSPVAQSGRVTFASLSRAIRINSETIATWAEILMSIQGSRLIIDSSCYKKKNQQNELIKAFKKHGVSSKQLLIGYHSPPWDLLRQTDISLDCFPHNSGTTLVESLYMGVPFITLSGRPGTGTLGSAILSSVGHPEWIAKNKEEYVALALELADNKEQLARTRANLRTEMKNSPLMDEPGFAKKIETSFIKMFSEWVSEKNNKRKITQKIKGSHKHQLSAEHDKLISLFASGKLQKARQLAEKMIGNTPENGHAWKILGPVLLQLDERQQALTAMQRAVSLLPDDYETHYNHGVILQNCGKLSEAESSYRRAVQLKPDYAEAYGNLGFIQEQLNLLPAAEKSLQKALKINPKFAIAHNNLGNVLKKRDQYRQAEKHFRLAIQYKADFVEAYSNLGNLLKDNGLLKEAEEKYLTALQINPNISELHYNLANSLRLQGKLDDSIAYYQKALAITPSFPMAYNNLGVAFNEKGAYHEAKENCQKAIDLDPSNIEAYSNLGGITKSLGQYKEAKNFLLQALQLKPDFATAHGNLLFLMNYHPNKSGEEIFELYKNYNNVCGLPLKKTWQPHSNSISPNRRLKIGYLTAPFFDHPIRYFFEPLLAHHDHDDFEVFVYIQQYESNPIPEDYRNYVDHWVPTKPLGDATIADRIRLDEIDILVDIAGHTIGNRLGVMARKPAPVSLHWLDFGYTTGLTSIDYYLTDEAHAPKGSEHLFSETPWLVDTPCLVYRPSEGMGEVGTLPAINQGFITFGTLTRAIRINHRTIRTWAKILKRVPNSVLVIDSGSFKDPKMQLDIKEEFKKFEIDPTRIRVGCHSPPWDLCRQIDIGFDCFPHNSGTTLFESLYMGIPIVTLADRPSVGRLGSSLLKAIGHPEWIAQNEEEYINIAVELAGDYNILSKLRLRLREEMQQSALMDEPGFAKKVEKAYRQMFTKWCKEKQ